MRYAKNACKVCWKESVNLQNDKRIQRASTAREPQKVAEKYMQYFKAKLNVYIKFRYSLIFIIFLLYYTITINMSNNENRLNFVF